MNEKGEVHGQDEHSACDLVECANHEWVRNLGWNVHSMIGIMER